MDVGRVRPGAGMSEAVVDDVRRDVGGQRHAEGALWERRLEGKVGISLPALTLSPVRSRRFGCV